MVIEDIKVIITKMNELGFGNKIVFKDENGKFDPIICEELEIYGLFISSVNNLWAVDGSKVTHDMFGNIQPWYYSDKHLVLKIKDNDLEEKILAKLKSCTREINEEELNLVLK